MKVTLNHEEIREAVAMYLREKKLSHNFSHTIENIDLYDCGALMTSVEVSAEVCSSELTSVAPCAPSPSY
jgi:hypothetical protein